MTEKEPETLAMEGGRPAVTISLPNWPPHWPSVVESVSRALTNGSWGQYHGLPHREFVEAFSKYLNTDFVWPCSSGTIAVELALRGCGVGEKDEVILAGYDFSGNFRAIESIAARPMLVDVQPNGYVVSARDLEDAVNERTRAVVVSHLHGQLVDMQAIREVCSAGNIAIIEDACQVPGAIVNGRPAGTQGDAGVFSFGGSKLLTAGRGGAVVTRNEEIMQRIRIAAERGNDAFPFSALQAAALTPQIQLVNEHNRRRLNAAIRLRNAFSESRLFTPVPDPWNETNSPAFFKFPIQVPDSIERQSVIDALVAEGVPAGAGFRGFTRRSSRRCGKAGPLDNARRAAEKTIVLHHPMLLGSNELMEQIINAFEKVEQHFDGV